MEQRAETLSAMEIYTESKHHQLGEDSRVANQGRSLSSATCEVATKQRSHALTTKFLHLCFVSYGASVSYSVRLFKAASLFSLNDKGNEGPTKVDLSEMGSGHLRKRSQVQVRIIVDVTNFLKKSSRLWHPISHRRKKRGNKGRKSSSDPSHEGSKGGKSSSASSDLQSQFHEVQFPSSGDGNCFGMGCGTSGSKLYLLGGQNPDTLLEFADSVPESEDIGGVKSSVSGEDGDVFPRYSQHDYSSRVFMLDLESSDSKSCYVASKAREMLSGMASPLVITVEEKLYVLAGPPVSMLPDYPFEVYDPKNNSWEKLPSPPFLKPNSMFFQDPQVRSHVVIDNKIHMSTSSSSFSFDLNTREWTSCSLFDDPCLKRDRPKWMDIQYPTHFRWMKYPPDKDEQGCGLPFDFDGRAVTYGGDVMIGLVPSTGHVVAYELVGGKVKRTQRLKELEIPLDATSAYLADFGDGYFCLMFDSNNCPPDCQIFITPFRVSKIKSEFPPTGEITNFLHCSPRITHSFKVPASSTDLPSKICSFIGCFVRIEGR